MVGVRDRWRLFHRVVMDGLFGWKGWVWGFRRHGRVVYVGAGLSARTMARSRSASGQADANAMRMRVALSITRAAILSSRRVVNSAFSRAAVFAIACWTSHNSQQAAGSGVQDHAHLIGIG